MLLDLPTLRTARLTLVPIAREDLDAYASMYGDPVVMAHIGAPMDREETWNLMGRLAGHWVLGGVGVWTVRDATTGEIIGAAGAQHDHARLEPEIGWIFGRSSWGQGFATEAAQAALTHIFRLTRSDHVVATIAPSNVASLRIADKLEMVVDRAQSTDRQLFYRAVKPPLR